MKVGKTLQELATEVQRQQETKRDFIAQTKALTMTEDLNVQLGSVKHAEPAPEIFGVNEIGHDQIAGHLNIPRAYYDKMRESEPALLAHNVNTWFHRTDPGEKRMLRTLDGRLRAFMSNSYRPLDNSDLLEAVLPPLMKMGVEVMSCEVTDRRLYLKVVDERIKKDLPTGVELGKGHHRFDTVSPAMVISNSEVGKGALNVQTSVWTGGCTNLAVISERSQRTRHLGGRQDIFGEDVYSILSERSKKLTDAALWSSISDVVTAAFNEAQFDALTSAIAATAQNKITGDPVAVVELTAKKLKLSDDERGSVLRHLISSGDLSQYGMHAAITRTAEDSDSYDRASKLEQIGGQVIELKKAEWATLAKAA